MTPAGVARLKTDEGLRLEAYPDSLSPLAKACRAAKLDPSTQWRKLPGGSKLSGAPWTIGYGHTGGDVSPGQKIDKVEADALLAMDVLKHERDLHRLLPWVKSLDAVRLDAVENMHFNLGGARLQGFKKTLALLKARRFVEAADEMLESLWAVQVGARAERLSREIATGNRG